jgi:hypothetical protein
MNERIKQLIEQAGFETDRGPLIVPGPYIRVGGLCVGVPLEKFAELIIKDCLNQCYNNGMNDELYAGQLKAAAYIEQHFGVEE